MSEEKPKPKIGRPTLYGPEMVDRICGLISTGHSLRQIENMDGMPDRHTILDWLQRHPEFPSRYARAMEMRTEYMADEMLEIADDGRNDWVERENDGGGTTRVVDYEHIARSRLRVDARKWLMAKMMPKKYGDRVVSEHVGEGGGPIRIKAMTDDELERIASTGGA